MDGRTNAGIFSELSELDFDVGDFLDDIISVQTNSNPSNPANQPSASTNYATILTHQSQHLPQVSHQQSFKAPASHSIDDPKIASVIGKQVKQRRATCQPSGPPQPSKVSSKVNCKRTAGRDREKVDALQQQLDSMIQQVNTLTVSNQQLQLKAHVLDLLMESMETYEAVVENATQNLDHHSSNPSLPPTGAAAFRNMSPIRFLSEYRRSISRASKWVLQQNVQLSDSSNAELQNLLTETLTSFHYAGVAQPNLVGLVHQELLKQMPANLSEEQHWTAVARAMRLTPDQRIRISVAQDIYSRICKKILSERSDLGDEVASSIVAKDQIQSFKSVLCADDEALICKLADNIRKQRTLVSVMTILLYEKLLVPMQVAICAVYSHPLMPSVPIILKALSEDVEEEDETLQPAAA